MSLPLVWICWVGSVWLQGGPGWGAHRCHLPDKHSTALRDQHCHIFINVLCHPLPTCSRRAPPDHHTHFPFHLQLSQVSPRLSPAIFKLHVPPTLSPGAEASTTPQQSAHRAGLGEKRRKLTTKLPQAPGQPAIVTSLCSPHGRLGRLEMPLVQGLPGWVLSGAMVLLLAGFASS